MRGSSLRLPIALLLIALATRVAAFEIEYSSDRPEQLKACDAHLYAGRTAEARLCYSALVDDDDDVRIKAIASHALGEQKAANSYFQTAIEAYPEDVHLRSRWGDLFRSTHQDNEAVKLYQESLEIDAEYRPAILGLVKVASRGFSERTTEWIDEVLGLEPDDIEAHILRARLELEDGAIDDAEESLERALEIAEAEGITPLEIYALNASVDLLRGNADSEWTQKALALNPRYGEIYATPAHFYVITRRYREAVDLLKRAVEIEPTLYSAHAELGINLLRENLVGEAQLHLATAYGGDPFSTEVVNTLRLIDSLDNFVVESHPPDPAATRQTDVILRLHRDESDVLEPYVLDLVRKTIDTFTDRYNFQLREPVIVELYPEHDDFAVRTSGLPGIGLLGVTFGYLVAMDSPTGRPAGDFHWGTTLWHEMAHVFTLEATNHLVPRWFSEGVSVHEEWSTGPLPGRHISLAFFEALAEDKLLPVAELDRGFIRPSYANQIIVSYMQAGLICQYISENFGQAALASMLDSFKAGLDTREALSAALSISAGQFDEQFDAYLETEFGSIVENYEQWRAAQSHAYELAANMNWEATIDAASEAIELFPQYVDEGNAYLVKARAQTELGERDLARLTLSDYYELGGYNPEALNRLAGWLREAGRADEAIAVLEDVTLVAPLDQQLHTDLGDLLLEAGRNEDALREYQALLAMNPIDQAAAHLRLARAYLALDEAALGREHLLYALEIAPQFREAQELLLETIR